MSNSNIMAEQPVYVAADVNIRSNVLIRKYSYMMPHGTIYANTVIGRYCSISSNVTIAATPHPTDWLSTHTFQFYRAGFIPEDIKLTPIPYEPEINIPRTTIGNDVWIGTHATIMQGITIGDGAIIAAGAVVTKDVAPYAIVGGVPAKLIRHRFDEETIQQLLELKWWELDADQLNDVQYDDIQKAIAQVAEIKTNLAK
ncbi:MAG TPA: CatB-related O-acetyltransferase [Alphaproteobacteria bacterium]